MYLALFRFNVWTSMMKRARTSLDSRNDAARIVCSASSVCEMYSLMSVSRSSSISKLSKSSALMRHKRIGSPSSETVSSRRNWTCRADFSTLGAPGASGLQLHVPASVDFRLPSCEYSSPLPRASIKSLIEYEALHSITSRYMSAAASMSPPRARRKRSSVTGSAKGSKLFTWSIRASVTTASVFSDGTPILVTSAALSVCQSLALVPPSFGSLSGPIDGGFGTLLSGALRHRKATTPCPMMQVATPAARRAIPARRPNTAACRCTRLMPAAVHTCCWADLAMHSLAI
mmetsp:Transcript_46468/g.85137  ORF Transcript_46468/g.85137 Transcript_46468/m.85137 type:complete len:288 (+) Transcript_46468:258-1121(+)